ncbi:MAG: hypothetical protein QXD34_04865 [Candidatus Bathyarchaeia archaeon]|nr:hypothetical protein [Candidatus Bathyarchaeota archaeon]
MTKKKKTLEEEPTLTEPIAIEASSPHELRANLEEIKNHEGVIGYILRNSTSATIDLKDPSKLIEYALLSASAIDAEEELSEAFNLGDAKNIIVEGKEVKILSFTIGENKVSIFTEKNADLKKIQEELSQI